MSTQAVAHRKPSTPAASAPLEELLTADEVGEILKMSGQYVRDHRKEIGFIRLGGNQHSGRGGRLRFRRAAVENYLRRQRAA